MPYPPDLIATAAIVAPGAVIGARCTIEPRSREPWLDIPSWWGSIVGAERATGTQ